MLVDYPDVRINIPPLSVMKDEISVAGEKNGVLAVVEKIKEISKVLVSYELIVILVVIMIYMMISLIINTHINERTMNYCSCPH